MSCDVAGRAASAHSSALFLVSHSHFGGAQELWANLVQGFRERGSDAQLFALYPDDEGEQETPAGIGWNYVAPSRPTNPVQVMRLVGSLAKRIRASRPDVIFTALPAANVLAPAAVTLARTGTTVVTTHHTPSETYDPKLDAVDSLTGRLRCVRSIVSVSDAVANSLRSKPAAYRSKIVTIRNAVPPAIEDLLATLAAGRAGRETGRTLVCSGRLAAQKNYPVIIRAMRHLPDATLQIVGAGPEEGPLRRMVEELAVSGRVEFLGQRSRTEALQIVSRGDVFVQMSLFEGNSLSLIEAAKLGLPLIVSDVPEQREGITASDGQACGLIVDKHDDVQLAAAARFLLDDPAAYAEHARRSAQLGAEIRFWDLVDSYQALASD